MCQGEEVSGIKQWKHHSQKSYRQEPMCVGKTRAQGCCSRNDVQVHRLGVVCKKHKASSLVLAEGLWNGPECTDIDLRSVSWNIIELVLMSVRKGCLVNKWYWAIWLSMGETLDTTDFFFILSINKNNSLYNHDRTTKIRKLVLIHCYHLILRHPFEFHYLSPQMPFIVRVYSSESQVTISFLSLVFISLEQFLCLFLTFIILTPLKIIGKWFCRLVISLAFLDVTLWFDLGWDFFFVGTVQKYCCFLLSHKILGRKKSYKLPTKWFLP